MHRKTTKSHQTTPSTALLAKDWEESQRAKSASQSLQQLDADRCPEASERNPFSSVAAAMACPAASNHHEHNDQEDSDVLIAREESFPVAAQDHAMNVSGDDEHSDDDNLAAKREYNRVCAAKSRENRRKKMNSLEEDVEQAASTHRELEDKNKHLREEVGSLIQQLMGEMMEINSGGVLGASTFPPTQIGMENDDNNTNNKGNETDDDSASTDKPLETKLTTTAVQSSVKSSPEERQQASRIAKRQHLPSE